MQIQLATPQNLRRISRKALMHDPKADTLAPPTDRDPGAREEPTNPLAAPVAATMLPPAADALAALEPSKDVEKRPLGASQPPSEFFERSYHQMVLVHAKQVELHDAQTQRDKDLFDADGKFAGVIGGVMDRRLQAFETKLDNRFSGIELKISKQAENIHVLELALKKHKEDSDLKFEQLSEQIRLLKEQRGAPGPETATAAPAV